MFKIDPDYFYTYKEIEKQGIASQTTIYRRVKDKQLRAEKAPNGENVIKGSELLNFMKKRPVAS